MVMSAKVSVALCATVLVLGCRKRHLDARIQAVQDTVPFYQLPKQASFAVTTIVHNDDHQRLFVALCGMEAQREIDGNWTTVFMPACPSNGLTPLEPGDSIVVPVRITAYTDNTFPQLDPRMKPGRYRILFGVFNGDPEGRSAATIGQAEPSTPFIAK
jgi:hypothetical protein